MERGAGDRAGPRGADRRFLIRNDPGRRAADRDAHVVLARTGPDAGRATMAAYLLMVMALCAAGLVGMHLASRALTPLRHDGQAIAAAGTAAAQGAAVFFDAGGVEMRAFRRAQIAALPVRPDVMLFGGDFWREAGAAGPDLAGLYNASMPAPHAEDLVGLIGWAVAVERLPARLVLAIHADFFAPRAARTDRAWEEGLATFRAQAPRFGLTASPPAAIEISPGFGRSLSAPRLLEAAARRLSAPTRPFVGPVTRHPTLDALTPDGSVLLSVRSAQAQRGRRARLSALTEAGMRRFSPPQIDAAGLQALRAVLEHLAAHGVDVRLVHPPFSPPFWEAVHGAPFQAGLARVTQMTASIAAASGFTVSGGFNPHAAGCEADQFFGADRAAMPCVGAILRAALAPRSPTAGDAS